MSDEIKLILKKLKLVSETKQGAYICNKEDSKALLDYITNLQEENERLKELCDKYEEEHNNEFKIWKDERQQLLDYKSRCEKGLDKLYCYGEVFDSKILQEFQKEMINTLTGGDKE